MRYEEAIEKLNKTEAEELSEKLLKLETLTTTVHFAIEIYKKVGTNNV